MSEYIHPRRVVAISFQTNYRKKVYDVLWLRMPLIERVRKPYVTGMLHVTYNGSHVI